MITTTDSNNNILDIYISDIDICISDFKEEFNIDELASISQNRWNGLLMYICKKLYKHTSALRDKAVYDNGSFILTNSNKYNLDVLNAICDYYIALCSIYDKEISIMGFSYLTGIDDSVIHSWGSGDRRPTSSAVEIYKKLIKGREESLSAKLATATKNPVGILAILNRHYAWNLPGVSKEAAPRRADVAAIAQSMGVEVTQCVETAADVRQIAQKEE